jgi:hypothetical protein
MRGGAGSSKDLARPKSRSRSRSRSQSQSRTASNYIYGYHGKVDFNSHLTEKDSDVAYQNLDHETMFACLSLELLEYDIEPETMLKWTSFSVDVFADGLGTKPELIPITPENCRAQYSTYIKPILESGGSSKGAVFVRNSKDASPFGQLEPGSDDKDVVRLKLGPMTSYWKIPRNLFANDAFGQKDPKKSKKWSSPRYGINQCQPAFLRAIRIVLGIEYKYRPGAISLTEDKTGKEWRLGVSGLEVTPTFWNHICEMAQKSHHVLEFNVQADRLKKWQAGIHLIGSEDDAILDAPNEEDIYAVLELMSESNFPNMEIPEIIEIWPDLASRIRSSSPSEVIPLRRRSDSVNALADILKKYRQAGYLRCFWWRPELGNLYVENIDNDKGMKWSIDSGRSLADFKKATQSLWDDGKAFESCLLVEGQAQQQRTFIITQDTTEVEWRVHIFDWLNSGTIYVKKIDDTPYSK